MALWALASAIVLASGAPGLPDVGGEAPPSDAPSEPTAPREEPAPEDPGAAPEDGSAGDPGPEDPEPAEPPEPSPEESAPDELGSEEFEPATEDPGPSAGEAAPVAGAAAVAAPPIQSPTIQQPSAVAPPPSQVPTGAPQEPAEPPTPEAKREGPEEPSGLEGVDESADDEESEEKDRRARKLGGFRFVRIGIAPKIGYTNGTSKRNGVFDREKSLEQSMQQGQVVVASGDDEDVRFGGGMWGFEADLEFFGVNVLLDFHKFFRPGGMWSLLLGYDHEIGLGKKKERLRLDVGGHFGMMRVFLGEALEDLYYDSNNPEAVNIATAGIEFRLMTALQIKIAGPLFTGPALMGGWHYLWTANAQKATKEQGLHFNAAWTLRLDFAIPRNRPGG
jgi:hypothetical protein